MIKEVRCVFDLFRSFDLCQCFFFSKIKKKEKHRKHTTKKNTMVLENEVQSPLRLSALIGFCGDLSLAFFFLSLLGFIHLFITLLWQFLLLVVFSSFCFVLSFLSVLLRLYTNTSTFIHLHSSTTCRSSNSPSSRLKSGGCILCFSYRS